MTDAQKAALGGGIGAGVGGLASLLSGGSDPNVTNAITQLQQGASTSGAQANQTYGQAQGGVDAIQSYLKPLLSGDRQAMTAAAAPQITQITDQYDSAFKSISELGPRGGGRTSALTTLRGKEASDVGNTIAGERDKALTAEQTLMQTLFGASQGSTAASESALSAALSALLQKSGQDAQSSSSLGSGIGSMIGLMAMSYL